MSQPYEEEKRIDPDQEDPTEKELMDLYFGATPEEIEEDKRRRKEILRRRCKECTGFAQRMLQRGNRPISRKDLLTAMEFAIQDRAGKWERRKSMPNTVLLVATVICRNILLDGPLHEE